jgi:hypothetical protein
MPNFRHIDYGKTLYETMRAYYAVNSGGEVSIMFKFVIAALQVLQQPFNRYEAYRSKEAIIASCKWQIGQLTNVLNFLYDPTLARIFITQSVILPVVDPTFAYPPQNFDTVFAEDPLIFERTFSDKVASSLVTINVPTGVNVSDLTATVEQIKLTGIPYQIIEF